MKRRDANKEMEKWMRLIKSTEITRDDMKNAKEGTIVGIGCRNCEGLEKHIKLANGK